MNVKSNVMDQLYRKEGIFNDSFSLFLDGYELRLESHNQATGEFEKLVTFNLYLISRNQRSQIHSTGEKYGYFKFGDDLHVFKESGMFMLSPNEKKLLYSYRKRFDDQTLGVELTVGVRPEVIIDGVFVTHMSLSGIMIIE